MSLPASGAATFLFTDIEGSTRLWEAHPEAMRAALARHDALLREAMNACGGDVFKSAGDGLCAVFADAAQAIAAACAAQRALQAERWPAPLVLRVRMALHSGPAEARDNDYFGPSLNRVARLLAAAHGGQTLISAATHALCGDRWPAQASALSLGSHELRDLTRREVVWQLCHPALHSAFPPLRTPLPKLDRTAPSIAVLPFADLSAARGSEYFADGLAEELLNVLAKIRGLRVASRTSAFAFRGRNVDIATVARTLDVATVLAGSVRRAGERVRVTAQLIEAATDSHLWSQTYDRTLDDILAVQDDIAHAVVTELRATLFDAAALAAAGRGRTQDALAHRLYLQARYLIGRRTHDETAKGIAHLEDALQRDPRFALAWVALAGALGTMEQYGWAPREASLARAREAVARALALDPQLPEAHAQHAFHRLVHDWDVRGAEASIARALALAPDDSAVLMRAGTLADMRGRYDEAIGLLERAASQDPLNAGGYANLGVVRYSAGRLADAEDALRKALDLAPQQSGTRGHLSQVLSAQGRIDEARAEAAQEPTATLRWRAQALVELAAGDPSAADEALRHLVADHADEAAFQIAEVCACRGRSDEAFAWLERARAQRDGGLLGMRSEPALRTLHDDPRWHTLLQHVGLADEG